jgi:type IV pilus assembly protein PilN
VASGQKDQKTDHWPLATEFNMRLDINLASQPYEDARQFWLRWGTALAAAAVLTLALMTITITGWFNARRDHSKIAGLRAEIAQRDRTREQAQAFLNQPENRTTRDESQFLNGLIERKSLSWTYVLEDLEKVMPSRVHLVSIHPELDEENQLTLKMLVAGDSRDKGIELVRRMEDSPHFSQTYIDSEHAAPPGSGDVVQFDINGIYVPSAAPAPKTPSPAATTPTPTPKTSTKTPTSKRSKP